MGIKKYISGKQKHILHKQRMIDYIEIERVRRFCDKLVMLAPEVQLDMEKFWTLREEMRGISRHMDNKFREHFLLRLGDINPLRKIIK